MQAIKDNRNMKLALGLKLSLVHLTKLTFSLQLN